MGRPPTPGAAQPGVGRDTGALLVVSLLSLLLPKLGDAGVVLSAEARLDAVSGYAVKVCRGLKPVTVARGERKRSCSQTVLCCKETS